MSTKLFIGNVPASMTSDDLVQMFEPYGEIVECDIVKNYAFLHYSTPESTNSAANNLNGVKFASNTLKVEVSHSKIHRDAGSSEKPRAAVSLKTTKLFVGNVPNCNESDLRKLFEAYGKVTECACIKDFAFIHYEHDQDASRAVDMLNGAEFNGAFITVEKSRSKQRMGGGGDSDACFNCGKPGHFSRDCRSGGGGGGRGGGRGGGGYRGGGDRYPPPERRPMYNRDPYDDYDDYYYRSRYAPPPRDGRGDPRDSRDPYARERLPPLPDRYRDIDLYDRPPPRYRDDPYDRPPPYYYDNVMSERRPRLDPYEDRYRSAMRPREEMPRRRAPPPY